MDELKDLVDNISQQYGIPNFWLKAIIDRESMWDPWSVRYEPNYNYLFKPELFKSSLISRMTEVETQKMSWGLGQVMGAVARQQGLTGPLAKLLDPKTNITHMCLLIKSLESYSTDPSTLFAMYNGGPGARLKVDGKFINQFYVDAVTRNMQTYIK